MSRSFTLLILFSALLIKGLCAQNANSKVEMQAALSSNESTFEEEVKVYDHSKKQDGYWMYTPKGSTSETKSVVVFIHGYGGYNPMIYGAWIRHLVNQGHVVIYPRYQKTLYIPKTSKFVPNTVTALKNALDELESLGYSKQLWEKLDYVVHSYGGVISSNITVNHKEYELPPTNNLMLCAPGSGPFKGGRLAAYDGLAEDINLVVLVNKNDLTVGDAFARLIFRTAEKVSRKVYVIQNPFKDEEGRLSAGHNECYALDESFDSGVRNYTAKKALRIAETNHLDTEGYWKIFDLMLQKNDAFEIFQEGTKEWSIGRKSGSALEVHHKY